MSKSYDHTGARNFYSNCSHGGNVPVNRILKDAKRAGLDFVMITGHFNLNAKRDSHEGWYDDVLSIVGEKISSKYSR
jgi:predicted metal-dependent phosphoesterase TrpH